MNNHTYSIPPLHTFLGAFSLLFCSFGVGAQIEINPNFAKNLGLFPMNGINTTLSEASPAFFRDKILFYAENKKNKKDPQSGDYYFDLYTANRDSLGNLNNVQPFSPEVNTPFFEGPSSFDIQRSALYFTRSSYDKNRGTSKDTISIKIYEASEKNAFFNPKALPFCSEKYYHAHPTLSKNGNRMIFASNRPGAAGKMDLFESERINDVWSTPTPLPGFVNSKYNEIFPFLYDDQYLIFTSDRPNGFGGYDLYVASFDGEEWSNPVPLPAPINSGFDDFGFIFTPGAKEGYFTSNRAGGKGKDDIYRVYSNEGLFDVVPPPIVIFELNVLDKLTLIPVPNTTVQIWPVSQSEGTLNIEQFDLNLLKNETNEAVVMKLTPKPGAKDQRNYFTETGSLEEELPYHKKYVILAKAEGYQEEQIYYDPKRDGATINMVLNPIGQPVVGIETNPETLLEKGSRLVFENIYYDYNSAAIQKGATKELDALVSIMKKNTNMRILLTAHTDARGDENYNLTLSKNRAEAAKKYLVLMGIKADRIETLGMGETRLRNHCIDDVICSEKEHQFNRRTEVTVIDIE